MFTELEKKFIKSSSDLEIATAQIEAVQAELESVTAAINDLDDRVTALEP
jgi:prefoldin subunit 5